MDFRKRFAVGKNFSLSKADPDFSAAIDRNQADDLATQNVAKLAKLQNKLYAQHEHALLIVLQALDAGGKDGTIKHVMSGVNPQGCSVTSFKQPSVKELDHDFLWRAHQAVPGKGDLGIFNRSHYEDVLIVRVHNLVPEDIWSARYRQIRWFEKILYANNTRIVKFFLNISREEQERRFNERLTDPEKNWKSSPADFQERKYWDAYQAAFQDALTKTSRKYAPWYVIPANKKWFRNYVVSQILVDTLEDLHLKYPAPASKTPVEEGAKKP